MADQQHLPDDSLQQQSLNIPQLLAFLLISALAVRWLFFSSSSSSSSTPSSSSSTSSAAGANRGRGGGGGGEGRGGGFGRRVEERHVEQVQAMFPQYGRREIMWDLARNGGSVQATIERILAGRGLDMVTPPPPPPSLFLILDLFFVLLFCPSLSLPFFAGVFFFSSCLPLFFSFFSFSLALLFSQCCTPPFPFSFYLKYRLSTFGSFLLPLFAPPFSSFYFF
jgi:hypothetical protein